MSVLVNACFEVCMDGERLHMFLLILMHDYFWC